MSKKDKQLKQNESGWSNQSNRDAQRNQQGGSATNSGGRQMSGRSEDRQASIEQGRDSEPRVNKNGHQVRDHSSLK
jgi:hypothetical protein